jgi:hypothetical protein
VYLSILVQANEHMGQLVAYARMTGVVTPWSKNRRAFLDISRVTAKCRNQRGC